MTTRPILSIITALTVILAPQVFGRRSKAISKADYYPLQVGYSWTYRNTEEGGYTLKVLSEEPHPEGTPRYIVELLSGVKILKTYSKADGWVLFHGENYPEHEGLQ